MRKIDNNYYELAYVENEKITINNSETIGITDNNILTIYNLIYHIAPDTKVTCADDLYRLHMGELQIYDHNIHCWRKT